MVKKVVHICKWTYMCMYIYFYIKLVICISVCMCVCITEKVLIDPTVHIAHAKQWENVQQLIRKMVRGIGYGVTHLKKKRVTSFKRLNLKNIK